MRGKGSRAGAEESSKCKTALGSGGGDTRRGESRHGRSQREQQSQRQRQASPASGPCWCPGRLQGCWKLAFLLYAGREN
eukprot:3456138-Rhodomonas_salina.1